MNKKIVLFTPSHIGDFIWLTSTFSIIKSFDKDIKIISINDKNFNSLIDEKFDIDSLQINYSLFCNKNKIIRFIYKIFFIFNIYNFIKMFKADSIMFFSTPPHFYILIFNRIYRIKNIVYGYALFPDFLLKEKYLKYCSKVINFQNLKDMHIMLKFQFIVKDYFKTYNLSIPKLSDTSRLSAKIKLLIGRTKKYKIALCTRGSAGWKFLDIKFLKDLILKINELYDASFFITGAGNLKFDDTDKLIKILPNVDIRSVYNKTSLLELTEFMKNMNLLISIDTGVVHISAAVNTPVISLCGPILPINVMPVSHNGVVLSNITCFPCDAQINGNNIVCKDMKCLKDISSNMVFEEVKKILK